MRIYADTPHAKYATAYLNGKDVTEIARAAQLELDDMNYQLTAEEVEDV